MKVFFVALMAFVAASSSALRWFQQYDPRKPCESLKDGVYSLPDVFSYLECKLHKPTIKQCERGMVFSSDDEKCEDGDTVNIKTFCLHRNNGNYRNPWNCHKFITCVHSNAYVFNCLTKKLVYNPHTDSCEEPLNCQCKQLSPPTSFNLCEGLADGNLALRDVFQYMRCKENIVSYHTCPAGSIYNPNKDMCIPLKTIKQHSFCKHRSMSNWRNPWNCHGYISCVHGITYMLDCVQSNPSLVYNPEIDMCVLPEEFTCKQYPIMHQLSSTNPCASKKDGTYPIRDVFKYMTCKDGQDSYSSCPGNYIYEPGRKLCVSITTQSVWYFCQNRTDGDWASPWSCHRYFKCENGQTITTPCILNYLNYNPYLDACVEPSEYPCHHVSHSVHTMLKKKAKDPCANLPDGNYVICDVFAYLQCKNHRGKNVTCPTGDIFSPKTKKCEDGSKTNFKTFCQDRKTGNYRDPWNCHKFIVCVHGKAFAFNCSTSMLVYYPYWNTCEVDYKCTQIKAHQKIFISTDPCSALKDGNYAIRDVFKYMTCKGHKATFTSCPKNSIYEPGTRECVSISRQTTSNFCQNRTNGDWVNPWNCHHFFKCYHGVSHDFQCQFSGLNFDPYSDACVYPNQYACHEVSLKHLLSTNSVLANPCASLKDGDYPIRDVFVYMTCKGHKVTYHSCSNNDIFEAGARKCVSVATQSITSFCHNRTDGDWVNPWNCHQYFLCKAGTTQIYSCLINEFNYNPYLDVCVRPQDYVCKQVSGCIFDMSETKEPTSGNNPCESKGDGIYSIPDVFSYLQCKKHVARYISCQTGKVFEGDTKKCVDGSKLTKKTFCKGRHTADYRNPWDCHSYITCVHGVFHERPCAKNILVYDPYNNTCEYASKFKCTELKTKVAKPEVKDICTTLPDGNYATRDVFSILQCKGHHSHNIACDPGFIYVPGNKKCTNATKINESNFCVNRTGGNWRSPWNCHNYFTCYAGHVFERKCSYFVVLNYDPARDICEYPSIYPCKNLTVSEEKTFQSKLSTSMNIQDVPNEDDPCKYLADGIYPVQDVFKMLLCHSHHHHYISCPAGQIFVPGHKKCTPAKEAKPDDFCKQRPDGNWRNPWNCHNYITCHAKRAFDRKCSILTTLNYNPDMDKCEYPYDYPCHNLTLSEEKTSQPKLSTSMNIQDVPNKDDPCKYLADGIYPVRNVFKMLLCHSHHHHYISCPPGQIFVPGHKKCTPAKEVKLVDFCKQRPNGNWRNPWDCHNYITCHVERAFDRNCSLLTTLNYNPDADMCEYPCDYPCQNVTLKADSAPNPCSQLDDGKYPIRDVFKFLVCKNKKGTYTECKSNQLYSAIKQKCVNGESLNLKNFCQGRSTGDWQNPWNCHGYLACVNGYVYERLCSKLTTLNYDSDSGMCEYPSKYPCKQLTLEMEAVLDDVEILF